jgi:hypothetical protein
MDEMNKNKMDDMEMDKVSGGAKGYRWYVVKKGTFSSFHGSIQNENANSMAANVDIDKTQNVYGAKLP